MHDPFEESLRDMLKASSSSRDDDACLGRVLKTANRQVGAGDLFSLMGRWGQAFLIAVNNGSAHVAPVSRRTRSAAHADKVD
ncbi:CrfX protein [Pseudomonas sp. nanlin1]|uniref:CrfX protein n=1 Tax=Pseudomonas sp. nanlin1 TaxID=3040605 RepID=UPI00388DC9F4